MTKVILFTKLKFQCHVLTQYFCWIFCHTLAQEIYVCIVFCCYFVTVWFYECHDDVIKWKHFSWIGPFVKGIHRSPVDSPHKASSAELWCFLWPAPEKKGWANNRDVGDSRRHRANYDDTVMVLEDQFTSARVTQLCLLCTTKWLHIQIPHEWGFICVSNTLWRINMVWLIYITNIVWCILISIPWILNVDHAVHHANRWSRPHWFRLLPSPSMLFGLCKGAVN